MDNYSNSPTNGQGMNSSNVDMNQPLFQPNKNMNMFAISAILCTILSWTCSCFAPVTIVFGSLAIIFALLSKGKELKTSITARITIAAAILGIIFSVGSTAYSAYTVFSDPKEYEAFKAQYETLTGKSFDEELQLIKELYHIPDNN